MSNPPDRQNYETFLDETLGELDELLAELHICEIAGLMAALLMRRIQALEQKVPHARRKAISVLMLELQTAMIEIDRERGMAR